MKKTLKITLAAVFFITFVFFIFKFIFKQAPVEVEIEEIEGIVITASIKLKEIKFRVYPEKRVPSTFNWSTIADFKVKNQVNSTLLLQKVVTTNNSGQGTITLGPSENIPSGNHSVLIKGISHLAKRYNNTPFFKQLEDFDFTPHGDLLAGDTHSSNDNVINSLDISSLISRLNTGDYINDLNQDSFVNSLDLSMQIYNLYKIGDE